MRPVDAYWGHFSAKSLEISTNGSIRSESSRQAAGPSLSLPPPALGERCHRGLARRLVAVRIVEDDGSPRPRPQRRVPTAIAPEQRGRWLERIAVDYR